MIDLDGYSGSYFQHALILTPLAPVQMNFLGYPATLGTPHSVQYIGTDRITNPPHTKPSLAERAVLMPWALMPTAHWKMARSQPALLPQAPVVGSFHKCGKLGPVALTVWANTVGFVVCACIASLNLLYLCKDSLVPCHQDFHSVSL